MRSTARVAPPNSILFISDSSGGDVPEPIWGQLILSTPSCISVGCLMFLDGETEVTLGSADEVNPGELPPFDADLKTPNRDVTVWTVEREVVLKTAVPGSKTRVRIWVNHPTEPDRVIIGLG